MGALSGTERCKVRAMETFQGVDLYVIKGGFYVQNARIMRFCVSQALFPFCIMAKFQNDLSIYYGTLNGELLHYFRCVRIYTYNYNGYS
jgi:hypothetical protein